MTENIFLLFHVLHLQLLFPSIMIYLNIINLRINALREQLH